jgi:L-ascorbate metabolism protein UlaG (beta-lactamase superfamily)
MGESRLIVPIGLACSLRSRSIDPVDELDWGESLTSASTAVSSVPEAHFSARSLFYRNRTLWCGYVIQAANRIIHFAGDTGYTAHFAGIRERFGGPGTGLAPDWRLRVALIHDAFAH